MREGLVMWCPSRAWAALPEILRGRGIFLTEQEPDEAWQARGGMRRCFTCVRADQRLLLRTVEEAALPEAVQVVIEAPPVLRQTGLLPDVIEVLRQAGARFGGQEMFRCRCGYPLFGNRSGRCPECGQPIAP